MVVALLADLLHRRKRLPLNPIKYCTYVSANHAKNSSRTTAGLEVHDDLINLPSWDAF